jgi:site-specific DNA-methyltransferase (adenine-specific)
METDSTAAPDTGVVDQWQAALTQCVNRVASYPDGILTQADAAEFLGSLPAAVADIVFLDPPFNLGKKYGERPSREDRLPIEDYDAYLERVLSLSIQALQPGGSLFLYHIPRVAMSLGERLSHDLVFRHWIAVSMKNGYSRPDALYPAHYALLYFTKGAPAHFARPKVPIRMCRHCGRPIKDYGGYARHVEDGLNLSDYWDDISPVRHKSKKTRSANELPPRIMERILGIAGCKGGLIVDPFAGSGLTAVVARAYEMRFAVNDRDETSCELIKSRLDELGGT